jgi:hypothetical protein
MPHVDIVKNEWLAGFQHVVARVFIDANGAVRVDTDAPERWEPIILRHLPADASDGEIGLNNGPEFVSKLHDQIHGDYLFATPLHDESECPFHERLVLPIEHVETQRPALGILH